MYLLQNLQILHLLENEVVESLRYLAEATFLFIHFFNKKL